MIADRPMRILIATASRTMIGGIEKYVQVLIPALLARGHAVAMLYEYPCTAGDVVVDSLELGLKSWYWDPGRQAALGQEMADWNPDLVYAHGFESMDLEEFLLDHFPVVLYAHVYQGTCITGRKCHAFPAIRPCERHFGPKCLALYYPRRCGGLNPWKALQLYQVNVRRNSRRKDYRSIIVASRHMYDEFLKHDVSSEKLHLVPLPITGHGPREKPPVPRTIEGRVLFIGRLTDLKGVRNLIEAIPIASNLLNRPLSLSIAGEGQQRRQLEGLSNRLGVAANFLGWLDAPGREDAMRQADLLAVPSLWPEPFGLVGIEAGCFGLPAVGYAVGGIPDWLIPGQTGELAPGDPPTVEGLAEAMARALADPEHHARLSRGAWELSKQFDTPRHLAMLEPILSAAVSVKPENREVLVDSLMTREQSE